jgi:putative ABC transport system permease protein
MFRNYLTIAWRLVTKHRLYSLINICGLALGLAACMLIGLYVRHEWTYDRFFPDAERIYRISRNYYQQDASVSQTDGRQPAPTNAPIGPMLQQEFAQVEAFARLFSSNVTLWIDARPQEERNFVYADASVFDVFAFDWVEGDPDTALNEPFSIVMTRSVADKYFPDGNAFGQSLPSGNGRVSVKVTGIIEDLPDNSHLRIEAFVALNSITRLFGERFVEEWNSRPQFHTYIKLAPGAALAELEREFPTLLQRHAGADAPPSELMAMNIADIHLRSERSGELGIPGQRTQVLALALIALGILAIACINFVNLATARSASRSVEIGVRKAIGAEKRQLVLQFLGESLFTTLLATLLALGLIEFMLPWFANFTGKDLDFSWFDQPLVALGLAALVAFVSLAAGSFPAFLLSSAVATGLLRGIYKRGQGGLRFRETLVVLQFSIAITLVIATAVMAIQMRYVTSFELGLDRNNMIIATSPTLQGLGQQWETMKQRLLEEEDIVAVSNSHYAPFTYIQDTIAVRRDRNALDEAQNVNYIGVGFDFFETYGIGLLAGRFFSEERGTDRVTMPNPEQGIEGGGSFIINAELARQFGWTPEEAVGQFLWMEIAQVGTVNVPIIGVVQDSYFEALNVPVRPMAFVVPPPGFNGRPSLPHAAIRTTGRNTQAVVERIEALWQEFNPLSPLNLHFLEADFDTMHSAQRKQGQLLASFAGLAIAIACLGLIGLGTHNAERRTKEIGVRKAIGGSAWSIVLLLMADFSKLVLISNVIAWPVAYVAMDRWLENFAYRIDLTPLIFIGSGAIALCIAWVAVGGTAAKAAAQKPVLALRYE